MKGHFELVLRHSRPPDLDHDTDSKSEVFIERENGLGLKIPFRKEGQRVRDEIDRGLIRFPKGLVV